MRNVSSAGLSDIRFDEHVCFADLLCIPLAVQQITAVSHVEEKRRNTHKCKPRKSIVMMRAAMLQAGCEDLAYLDA